MRISVCSDAPELEAEILYLCRLLGSILQADFCPVFDTECSGNDDKVIVYAKEDGNLKEYSDRVFKICRNGELWRKYLARENIEGDSVSPLIESLAGAGINNVDSSLVSDDLLFALLFLLSRYEEVFSQHDKDRHGRFQFENDTLSARGIEEPIVNLLIHNLAERLSYTFKTHISIRHNQPVAVVSHDIDIPFYYKKMVNEASVCFKSLFKRNPDLENGRFGKALLHVIGLERDPYDTYAYFDQQERMRDIRSTYFLLMSEENRWGLDLAKYRRRFKELARNGHEIALHPGYESFHDLQRTKIEKDKIHTMTGIEPVGTRSHFLRFHFPGTYEIREGLGFLYDSSLGYAESVGFRGGICTPYKPFDPTRRREVNILQIPMVVMDGTLRDYLGLSLDEAYAKIRKIAEDVRAVNGILVFNWHNSFFLGESSSWQKVYECSMDLVQTMGFEFMTCSDLARRWSGYWDPIFE